MLSSAYYRRQADICLRLSLVSDNEAISTRLVQMAKEYLATGEALESKERADGADGADRAAPTEDSTPFDPPTDTGASAADT